MKSYSNFSNDSLVSPLLDETEDPASLDKNVKYNLYIIVPTIWSFIIFMGIIGKFCLLIKYD